MEKKFASLRNLRFLLNDVHGVGDLMEFPYFSEHDSESFDLIIETASDIASDLLLLHFSDMDRNPPKFKDGAIKVHPAVKEWTEHCAQDGWIAAEFPYELGGQQLPCMVSLAVSFLFCAANYSMTVYTMLTASAWGERKEPPIPYSSQIVQGHDVGRHPFLTRYSGDGHSRPSNFVVPARENAGDPNTALEQITTTNPAGLPAREN